jgi:DNA-binding NtrC family response regulator
MINGMPGSLLVEGNEWSHSTIHPSLPGKMLAEDTAGAQSTASIFRAGNSPAMRDVCELIGRSAMCDMPVFITGESCVGQELVAREIHRRSGRQTGEFVAVNCAEISSALIAGELFGHEKGTFIGASQGMSGQVERAHRGTLFLDEIGVLPLDVQAHLLRLEQRGEIVRVGGREPVKVDVRLITATSFRLPHAITTGKLRDDLYYRLNVIGMHLPPLRERQDDIKALANYFLREIAREFGRNVSSISPAAIAAMEAHSWPGNVQELVATIRRAVVLSDSEEIQVANLRLDAELPVASANVQPSSRPLAGSDAERDLLLSTLQRNHSNIARTARELKVSRVTLYRMLHRNHLMLRQQYVLCDSLDSSNAIEP